MKIKFLQIIVVAIVLFVGFGSTANAALPSLVPSECRGDADIDKCNLEAVEQTLVNGAEIILGLSGSLALLMFVVAGFMYIFSGGNASLAGKAKSMMMYTIIGLALILFSGVILKTIVGVLVSS